MFSSASKAVSSFSSILLVTNQSGINFNAARKWLTSSSHVPWVIYLLGQYSFKKWYKKTPKPHISWVSYWSGIESNTKNLWTSYTFLECYNIQGHI